MRRKILRRALGAGLATLVALLAGEALLRIALFTDLPGLERLRRPERYASWFRDDDYWKLKQRFGTPFPPPEHPHPVLGWIGDFARETYVHREADLVGARRPVLLYGDSFAMCVSQVRCFQDILNGDGEFAREHYLLNYGVGGYGVDQILLLLQHSVDLYEDPFVVLSLMTLDLDRSVLSVRTGQKPRFTLVDGDLRLDGPPIWPDADAFFEENPPEIRSYLYRLALYSRLTPLRLRDWLRDEEGMIARKAELNEELIATMIAEVRGRGLDCCFVVFHLDIRGPDLWRDQLVRGVLEREGVPVIWSRDLVEPPAAGERFDSDRYILPGDGHPTTFFNERIAERIKAAVLAGE